MTNIFKYYLFVSVIFIAFQSLANEDSTFVYLGMHDSHPLDYIDNEIVHEEMYITLARTLQKKGRHSQIDVLVNANRSFRDIWDIKGMLQAVGFMNINFYLLSQDQLKTSRINMDMNYEPLTFKLPVKK